MPPDTEPPAEAALALQLPASRADERASGGSVPGETMRAPIVRSLACSALGALALVAIPGLGRAGTATPDPVTHGRRSDVAPNPAVGTASTRGELTLRSFLREDEFKWTIAGGGVNVISELDWDNVRSAGVRATGRLDLGVVQPPVRWLPQVDLALWGDLEYGQMFRGTLRDSDYLGANKTLEFSQSRSHTERGRVLDAAIGIRLDLPRIGRLRVSPILGLTYHQQQFAIRNGASLIPATGPIVGLDSEYATQWYGLVFGGEVVLPLGEDFELRSRCVVHRSEYRAEADFNLRTDLGDPSFEHATIGEGVTLFTGVSRPIGARWLLELGIEHRWWETDSGRAKFNLSAGGASRQRLNEVELRSFAVILGASYRF